MQAVMTQEKDGPSSDMPKRIVRLSVKFNDYVMKNCGLVTHGYDELFYLGSQDRDTKRSFSPIETPYCSRNYLY